MTTKTLLDSGHPYRVKPLGSIFLESDAARTSLRSRGLGPRLRRVSDESLLEVLFHCEAKELLALALTSKCLYVYCHYSDLWRDLLLRLWAGEGTSSSHPSAFKFTWKDSYILARYFRRRKMSGGDNSDSSSSSSNMDLETLLASGFFPHRPLDVRHVYSDLLHRVWACQSYDCKSSKVLTDFGRPTGDVDIVDAKDLSIRDFIDKYEVANKPVIIRNCVGDWNALTAWKSKDYLIQVCANRKFRCTSASAPVAAMFTLEEYFSYSEQTTEESPLYLFERDFAQVEQLRSDYQVPKFFSPQNCHFDNTDNNETDSNSNNNNNNNNNNNKGVVRTDLFRVLGAARPDYQWMILGPRGSGSIFHIDPNQTNAWNVCIKGSKKWVFYPPGTTPPGIATSPDLADVTIPLSIGEYLLTFWTYHQEVKRETRGLRQRPRECVVGEGELIFVPHGWWHMVVNLEDTIALTHNYVSTSNLCDCLRFLRDKVDQISGVRDRAGGSDSYIPPEDMYKEFTERLVKQQVLSESYLALLDSQVSSGGAVLRKRQRDDKSEIDRNDNTINDENSKGDFLFNFYE